MIRKLAAALAAAVGAVAAAVVLPAGLPQARPAADMLCWPQAGAVAALTPTRIVPSAHPSLITEPPPPPSTSPTGGPTFTPSPSWPPTSSPSASAEPSTPPTSSPSASASPCPTPTGWPSPTWSPTPPPTSPPPPGCPPLGDPPDYYEAQIPLLHAANDIDTTARGPVGFGYAGITIDVPECRIDVYWKGVLPSAVADVVSRYDPPINIEVHQDAPYASVELEPRADRLVNEPELAQAAGIDLVRVGWPQDGTGVTAGVLATEPPPDLAGAEALLSQELQVPVDLTVEEPYQNAGRQNDSPPWYAGGRTKVEIPRNNLANCSTGWGIKVGKDETIHVLTAAHCGATAAKVHNGDQTRQLGTLAQRSTDLDSAIIDVTSASARMFTGRPTANTSLVMERAAEVKVGAWICGSGASTGQNCDIRVDAVNERIETEIGWVRTTTSTHKDATGIAGGKGDSGGPVYIPVEKGTKVQAVGIIVAVKSEVACRRDDDTRTCTKQMAFVPVDPLLKHWKATLITG